MTQNRTSSAKHFPAVKMAVEEHLGCNGTSDLVCQIAQQVTAAAAVPVHAGVCAVVVEGVLWADAALLTLDATALRDGEGGAAALAGRDTGAVLHGVRTGDSCAHAHTHTGGD